MALAHNLSNEYQHWQPSITKIVDGTPVRFRDVCVLEIPMGDVEDPDLFVAQPIWEWQQSEQGNWVMENAVEPPYWTRSADYTNFGHVYRIMARLSEQDETFWSLKWRGLNK